MFCVLFLVVGVACARHQQTLNATDTNQQEKEHFPSATEVNSFCWKDSGVREPGYCSVLRNRWGEAPSGWVNCGMGAAKTKRICAGTIVMQVFSTLRMIGEIAALILSGGTSGALATAMKGISSKLAKAKTMVRKPRVQTIMGGWIGGCML